MSMMGGSSWKRESLLLSTTTMTPLSTFPLPLPADGRPLGFSREERDMSVVSTTTAFNDEVDERDIFLGKCRCIICGVSDRKLLRRCLIIGESDIWSDLKDRGWIPWEAKTKPRPESRDGLMCLNHQTAFNGYGFLIRFVPETRKFVFVNYSNDIFQAQFHGKAVALDIKDRRAPFPSLFVLHEMRVRGFNPFRPIDPEVGDGSLWQDWISSEGVFDDSAGSFKRDGPPNNECARDVESQLQFNPTTETEGGASSGGRRLELNANVVDEILAATCASASWKVCETEGIRWTGTAEENSEKYLSGINKEES